MPPEIYIGTDIVTVSRIRDLITTHPERFIQRTYTDQEQFYCVGKADPVIHYAGRFAAKEAIKKAFLSSKIISNIPLHSIEIFNEEGGNPLVNIHSNSIGLSTCKVSISHTEEFAIAFAFLTLS